MQTVDFGHFPLHPGDVVLDLGCGEGRHVISAYVEADVHSVGVDLSLEDLGTTLDKFLPFAEPDNQAKSFGLSAASALALIVAFAHQQVCAGRPAAIAHWLSPPHRGQVLSHCS